jgi:hypothetical protein
MIHCIHTERKDVKKKKYFLLAEKKISYAVIYYTLKCDIYIQRFLTGRFIRDWIIPMQVNLISNSLDYIIMQ